MKVPCSVCGLEHPIFDVAPSFVWPDAIFELPETQRGRAQGARNFCLIQGGGQRPSRWFLRVLLPFAVTGWQQPCTWGIWVEVEQATFDDVYRLWDAPDQQSFGPWPACIANNSPHYAPSRGLAGEIYFANPEQIPHLRLAAGQEQHGLAADWTNGVSEDRVREWQVYLIHPEALVQRRRAPR